MIAQGYLDLKIISQVYQEIGEVLYRNVNRLFLESLKAKESGREQLSHCLGYYLKMNKQADIERFVYFVILTFIIKFS